MAHRKIPSSGLKRCGRAKPNPMHPSRQSSHADAIELNEKARLSLPASVWWVIITTLVGVGMTYSVLQTRTTENSAMAARNSERITEVDRESSRRTSDLSKESGVHFEKLEAADTDLRREISNRAETYSALIADNNTRISVLTDRVQQASSTVEKLGVSIEKLADQIRKDRDERRHNDK